MRLTTTYDPKTQERVYVVRIPDRDLESVRLDRWDKRLLDECAKSNSVADALLGLQTLVFRMEQQA